MYNLKEAVFDAYPELRRSRCGLIALPLEAIWLLVVAICTGMLSDLGYDLRSDPSTSHPLLSDLKTAGIIFVGLSALLAAVGLIFDEKKSPSVIVLATFLLALLIAAGGPFV